MYAESKYIKLDHTYLFSFCWHQHLIDHIFGYAIMFNSTIALRRLRYKIREYIIRIAKLATEYSHFSLIIPFSCLHCLISFDIWQRTRSYIHHRRMSYAANLMISITFVFSSSRCLSVRRINSRCKSELYLRMNDWSLNYCYVKSNYFNNH